MAKRKYKQYEVLRPVRSDKAGKHWTVGEIVTSQDFKADIIRGWLEARPPVLRAFDPAGADEEE